jgi:hypothetical protein
VPQLGQAWWGNLASPHWGHSVTWIAAIFLWVLRISRFDFDVFLLGTAIFFS